MAKHLGTHRIAVDVRALCHPGTGIYRYTREMLSRLCPMGGEWFFYSISPYDQSAFPFDNVHHHTAGLPAALRIGLLGQCLFPRWARRDDVDVFWSPRHHLPLMLSRGVRCVVTIHDLVWQKCGDTMRFPGRQLEATLMPRSLALADDIVVVSEFTGREVSASFPQVSQKISVIPNASHIAARPGSPANPGEGSYFLTVGTLEPRKNLPRLLRAYRRYVDTTTISALPLRIVGGQGWGGLDVTQLVRELGLEPLVEITGRVSDDALLELYRGARALLMPSLYEGFGLPIVEALSQGVPVITSENSAMSEVAGGGGLFIDPLSEPALSKAMIKMAEDNTLHAQLAQLTRKEAARYSWGASCDAMAKVLFV